jgi:hypothetical protein
LIVLFPTFFGAVQIFHQNLLPLRRNSQHLMVGLCRDIIFFAKGLW